MRRLVEVEVFVEWLIFTECLCVPQAMQLSRDGQYLLTGGDHGVVVVWQVSDLKQLFAYPGCDAGIRAMALSYDQR